MTNVEQGTATRSGSDGGAQARPTLSGPTRRLTPSGPTPCVAPGLHPVLPVATKHLPASRGVSNAFPTVVLRSPGAAEHGDRL